ncbi:TDP-N-acetylfucosamine:lipid II N-acetylfucosaminyltransferase [Maribacter arenosus]|uniref:TDP-N-acetylfucosamine:lipid II N-acetylfucosaminyltransferase n=1 Tax=Maribacter arenosus TaxID=1854708 RepID=A0ABR7VBA9_9FLAO|nr:TDP-N-acetylfucosamine:lipid II N-acetylfucosaminyltransferase [Maribacter arenosus]MBD0849822.1 TDP-N-acetylfucosamine:lipid II N-acetylfucosaminyltransferase [Maribacter arenosus]
MKKIIHIHTDYKFIVDSERYMGEIFVNEILILGTKNSSNSEYHDKAQFFDPHLEYLNEILTIVNSADALVIYSLDFYKSKIINRVDKRVKIIWRFFGTELYSRKLHLYLSTKSKSFVIPRLFKGQIKSIFRFIIQEEKWFYRAIRRTDAITCVFKEEYDYLIRHWDHLPKFIPLSLENRNYSKAIDFELDYPKKNTIVIGNSRAYYNNHLDILEIVERCKLDKKINIRLLFNYGAEDAYTHRVRQKVDDLERVTLLDSFIPPHEFIDFYGPVAAFVTNSYRQLALGNIFLALHKGVKVYLNKKNPTYTWFKEEGLYIYEIEHLKNDLETGRIHLTKNEIEHNLKCLNQLKEDHSKADFQLEVLQLLNN